MWNSQINGFWREFYILQVKDRALPPPPSPLNPPLSRGGGGHSGA